MTGVTYDSGALIAAERGERPMWARHRALLLRRVVPTVPASVLAQCWRGTPRQAQLARLLAGCEVEVLDDSRARATGTLAGRAHAAKLCAATPALAAAMLAVRPATLAPGAAIPALLAVGKAAAASIDWKQVLGE